MNQKNKKADLRPDVRDNIRIEESRKMLPDFADWCDNCIFQFHPQIMMSPASGYGQVGKCEHCGRNAELRAVKVPEIKQSSVEAEGIGGENQPGATSGNAGGMFGGTDLEGPSFKTPFHVGFTFRGKKREASFSSLNEANAFVKGASAKFGKIAGNFAITSTDVAKRNLVLELLKNGKGWTTGGIEKAMGGGKYTNNAYGILAELAKEGLVKHKQMRWYLKTAEGVSEEDKALAKNPFLASADDPQGINDGHWSNYETEQLDLYLDNESRETYELKQDMVRRAIKEGLTPEQLAQQLKKAFRRQYEQLKREFEQPSEEPNWVELAKTNMDYERKETEIQDNAFMKGVGISMASLKSAKIRITSAKPMPRPGTPEAAELKIAIQTLKMPAAMADVMGGPGVEHAHEVLARYGMVWDEEAYMAGGKGVKKAGEGMAKTEMELEKEAGFNFFFPGQVLKEFYPEIQHEIVDYPNASNQPMSGAGNPEIVGDAGHELEGVLDEALDTSVVEMIQLPADVGDVEPLAMAAADYSSTSPAGGMGIGRDGKPEVLEGAPLRKENDIRGQMFTDEFYGQYEGIPGAAMAVASKIAADGDEAKQFALFLKKVCGEIASTLIAAFKTTSRPLLNKVPGMGELQLDTIEQGSQAMSLGQITQGGRVKYLMGKLNDGDVKAAINSAWAQAAVWNDNPEGGFVYEVFVRPETIDTESLVMKYKFVCGTRE